MGFNNQPAPRPENLEAMAAAWNDPVEFARQKAIYNEQLRQQGYAPLYEVLDFTEPRESED